MNSIGLRLHIQAFRRVANSLSHSLRFVLAFSFAISLFPSASAQNYRQIIIGGNVYGAGNEGDITGNTTVTVKSSQINGDVYGGARMADVGGHAFVNIDGEHTHGDIMINTVYGGNDVAGTVGKNIGTATGTDQVPTELTDVLRNAETLTTNPEKNDIDNSWSAFVRTSRSADEENGKIVVIGSLYGGGNGDYTYSQPGDKIGEDGEGNDIVSTEHRILDKNGTVLASSATGFTRPELEKTYLELKGGLIPHVYGGGNNATVTDNTTLDIDNQSFGLNQLITAYANYLKSQDSQDSQHDVDYYKDHVLQMLIRQVHLSVFQSDLSNLDYNMARVFGGNNKATMAIHPVWNLKSGKVRDLYSGGNQGDMTNSFGLIMDIPASSHIKVENVYGGCRRADVRPAENGVYLTDAELANIQLPTELGYKFPKGYTARTIVRGGDIDNVYGGNDIAGDIYGGSAVGVYTSIRGNVYGGGNGSYAYTDNANLKDDPDYGDFYYDVNSILGGVVVDEATGNSSPINSENFAHASAVALTQHRPNVERVSLRLWGPSEDNPTIIGGSVYVGGNSATLKNTRSNETATAELKIGSHVYANNVFLGNNGENMINSEILNYYNSNVTVNGQSEKYSQLDLTKSHFFSDYMKGCASFIKPQVVFDQKNDDGTGDPDTYKDYTTYFGSFFCGGNVGSMMWEGTEELNLDRKVIVYNKIVGGCNNANVSAVSGLNAAYTGGVLGTDAEQKNLMVDSETGKIKDALVLNLSGFKIEPMRWVIKRDGNYEPVLTNGKPTYLAETCGCELSNINEVCSSHSHHAYLEWNTIDRTGPEVAPQTTAATGVSNEADLDRRLQNGNIYGGCYSSGIVIGNVVINVNETLMEHDVLFDKVEQDELGEAVLYDDVLNPDQQTLNISERRTGVLLDRQGMDVLGKALNVFGGGFGKDTEIWGGTTINLNAGYVFQIFGGSEKGVIGMPTGTTTLADGTYTPADGTNPATYAFNGKLYEYNDKYSCTVNVRGTKAGVSKQDDSSEEMSRSEFIYGGGFMGPICGNTKINLGNGRVFNTFAGSCMADILGHTETYMGVQVDKKSEPTGEGFPYIRDYIYCGNDLGGRILGEADFSSRVRTDDFDSDANTTGDNTKAIIQASTAHTANVTKASAYVEYHQGRAEGIFGGCFGTYDYSDPYYGEYFYATGASDIGDKAPGTARSGYTKPRMNNAFVNFRPTDADALLIGANKYNFVNKIYGAGQGYPADADRDIMQKSSYVLIDIPQRMTNYQNMEVFGAGAWGGLGMDWHLTNKTAAEIAALDSIGKAAYADTLDVHSATIDLVRGQVGAAYGGSYAEGVTRRTMVNVPDGSTIRIGSIFGGAYGTETFMPCDVYESNVEYHSANAALIYNPERKDDNGITIGNPLHNGSIYGGNNNERRTLYTKINIDKRVNQAHYQYGMSRGYVYGAGKGGNTWAEYTEVNLNDGAEVYEVYGGGQAGKVMCAEAVTAYKNMPRATYLPVDPNDNTKVIWPDGTYKAGKEFTDADFANAWSIGKDYDPASGKAYWETAATNLTNPLVRWGEVDDREWVDISKEDLLLINHKYNTNVLIREGAYVANYAYGGGLGEEAMVGGHAYIALLGGTVNKDIYAGGTSGAVEDAFSGGNYSAQNTAGFEATTTAYIKGGTVRNVYGGGWRGAVGHHVGAISADNGDDVPGESHVIIGDVDGTSHVNGIPSVTRNVYGGGEGGAIFGTAYVKINNGYIGYRYTYKAVPKGEKIAQGATYYALENSTYTEHTATDEITVSADNTYYQMGYKEELDDAAPGDNLLDKGGNVFGGGYVANSYTDYTDVKMFGGTVRGCLFGGGEIGPVGRGTVHPDTLALGRSSNVPRSATDHRALASIYKAGETDVHLYGGHVLRDVFGGGRGYDNWNGQGWMSDEEKATMDLSSKGYVFGKTYVYIRGGEVGTEEGVAKGFGNVFGGGDRGFIYSAFGERPIYFTSAECIAYNTAHHLTGSSKEKTTSDVKTTLPYVGVKSGVRYNIDLKSGDLGYDDHGYYYQYDGSKYTTAGTGFVLSNGTSGEKMLTEDCKVVLGPQCQVKPGKEVRLENVFYPKKAPIPPVDIKYLRQQNPNRTDFDAKGVVTAEEGITIASRTYQAGDYIPTYALQAMGNKTDPRWANLNDEGIIIHNAVFAGGNVSSGDDQIYANAPTVFGNATASIHDIYHRDLITIGTGHVGGLYGDGNLTFVDGYRGLNITNYGTDFHNLRPNIEYNTYLELSDREKTYYELKYRCEAECYDNQGKKYKVGDMLTYSDLQVLFESIQGASENFTPIFGEGGSINEHYWKQNGVCSRYAGRIMNTIQRADFCGVFGSRMVLQGAPDRVPETVDYTNYTVNRVREISLNKKVSIIAADATSDQAYHGNYFGIYSIVHYLGAITSDVDIKSVRKSESEKYPSGTSTTSYLDWKAAAPKDKKRNIGTCHNKIALASGVYLELTSETSAGKTVDKKDWGYVTGVVELDLINVQPGVGGGYVYAKNVHGTRSTTGYKHITLTALNNGAVTRRDYAYSDDSNPKADDIVEYETSGNFVNDTQTILDDCYDMSNSYKGAGRSPAHLWYIWGHVYVYEEYISAYTGSPAAYKETVNIPLTITAASHGKLQLINVQPNYYAYYKDKLQNKVLGNGEKLELNNSTYYLNDPIDYWAYSLLSPTEKALFVPMTYTTIAECTIGETTYPKGTVLLPGDATTAGTYNYLKAHASKKDLDDDVTTPDQPYVHNTETNQDVDFDFVFRQTNTISHDTGYLLTYGVTNPMEWNEWYTPISGSSAQDKINTKQYSTATQSNYYNGPTFRVKEADNTDPDNIISHNGIYGQQNYVVSNIIDEGVYNAYSTMISSHTPSGDQATFEQAFIVTADEVDAQKITGTDDPSNPTYTLVKLYKGAGLAKSEYTTGTDWPSALNGKVAPAYVSTTTIQFSNSDILYTGDLMTAARKQELIDAAHVAGNSELETTLTNSIVPAYYCTSDGLYGGNYYETGYNYRALEAWSSMSPEDREHFTFNYDALDLLVDPTYGGDQREKYQYDAKAATLAAATDNKAQYSLERPVDYTATYDGTESFTYIYNSASKKVNQNDILTREEYEAIPNEQYHYASILVEAEGNIYVVNNSFVRGEIPYAVGQTITAATYNGLGDNQRDVTILSFDTGDIGKTFYYCRDSYTISAAADVGKPVKAVKANGDIAVGDSLTNGQTVPVGFIIAEGANANEKYSYKSLVNKQLNFTIHGVSPVETSTFYVARNSDIYDLSKERIITVVYQYDYEESDKDGMHITPVSERHVVNIHLRFKSGIPAVETITAPDLVLPGTYVVIRTPNVTPGAYEVLGGGWEIYRNATDAENHRNGKPYTPNASPLYWYQDGYHVAYYAKTYLGKTYSNAVPLSVANYHDLKKVMDDKVNHYYVDNTDVKRDPKIYINDYTTDDPETTANSLEVLKNFFDLTTYERTYDNDDNPNVISNDPNNPLYNHVGVETDQIGGCKNLEFILRTDLAVPSGETWTSIGKNNTTQCFEGIFHGDGHTISGLNNSLFAHLCGDVYNLGVTGTFTSAGLADEGTGFVENCWVKSDDNNAKTDKPVFNKPTNTTGSNPRTVHMVNCYYPEENQYTDHDASATYGKPIEKPLQSFYDGEVTYDLNEFYLFKRYSDQTVSADNDYSFWQDVDGTLTKQTGHYPETSVAPYLMNDDKGNYVGSYVERRFADGDFIYAAGTIPGSADVRYWTETTQVGGHVNSGWAPIWPDDYLYFGQMLTYDHVDGRAHQALPTVIRKNGDRLPTAATSVPSNRVYRAPAYFRSLTMGSAYFNPDAVFAQTKKGDASLIAHKNMTAIDFTGGNGDLASGYQKGLQDALAKATATPGGLPARFYPPLLDDDGLFSMQNIDLTRNLLVYTGTTGGTGTGETPTTSQQTANVVSAYLVDKEYAETDADYRTVDVYDTHSNRVLGHWVQGNSGVYTASRDHLLVDKNDFNAPISYQFADGKRMWYQRTPDSFVDRKMGWEGVSLPFAAEIVTTQDKGELTHFYQGSTTGHEYWLRRFTSGGTTTPEGDIYKGVFTYPDKGSHSKDYTNTFLWDYYYQYSSDARQDENTDKYQQEYYKTAHTYNNYPYSVAGTPYIIGFPGTTYYEFDLSGTFVPANTRESVAKLQKQTVTFASPTGVTVAVSDTETLPDNSSTFKGHTEDGYTFHPSYLNESFAAGTNTYTLQANYDSDNDASADCSSFVKVPETGDATNVYAFRPYFTYSAGGSAKGGTRAIIFSDEASSFEGEEEHDPNSSARHYLDIRSKERKIIVTSHLESRTTVTIYSVNGTLVTSFAIEPEQTIETDILSTGVYIVNKKKLLVGSR